MAVAQILPFPTTADNTKKVYYLNEITELAAELRADDPTMQQFEAINLAASMLDRLEVYAEGWDAMAFMEGNDDAMPF